MNRAVLEDEKRFFEIVQTTPDLIEARSMLDDALEAVKMEMAYTLDEMHGRKRVVRTTMLGALKTRIKSEIHRVTLTEHAVSWQRAVKDVLGQEAFEKCVTYIQAIKQEHGR